MFNNTTVFQNLPVVKSKIDAIKDKFNPTSGHVVDGSVTNAWTFRTGLIPTGLDLDDGSIRYLRNKDIFDCMPYDEYPVVCELTVDQINRYFSNQKHRAEQVDIFKFEDYVLNWDGNGSGTSYLEADKVWLANKDGTKVTDLSKKLVVAINSYTFKVFFCVDFPELVDTQLAIVDN